MKQFLRKFSSMLVISLSLLLVQGCSDPEQENVNRVFKQTQTAQQLATHNYKKLSDHVGTEAKKGKYEMAMFVALSSLSSEMPDNEAVQDMVKQFKLDTTKNGAIWKQIDSDYKNVLNKSDNSLLSSTSENAPKNKLGSLTNLLNSYNAFNTAHNLPRYDERFIDYINTLAAISKNINPVIVDKLDDTAPVGSAFVGNPQYGQWVKDNNGNEMWQFLETYMYLSFLDNMLFDNNYRHGYSDYRRGYRSNPYGYSSSSRSNNYRYDNWSNKRNYSYYNDTYVNKYAKSSEKKKYKATQSNLTKKYTKTIKPTNNVSKQMKSMSPKNKAFQSNLAKPRTTSSTGGKNTGASSGKKASQSNLKSSSKSVRTSSKSVSTKSGK